MRFNPPPGWPPPPEGFTPQAGWRPDPSWPPAPPGWQLWVADDQDTAATSGPTPGSIGPGSGSAPAGFTQSAPWGPPAPPPSGSNGMAIAAFVLGLLGFVWICAILGIVFGIVALGRARRTFQQGRGLAIAGIVLGSVWLALQIVLVAVLIAVGTSSSPSPAQSSGAGSQTVDPFTLTTGDCFDNPTPTVGQTQTVTSVTKTLCTQPHNAQIFATFRVSGSLFSYPGDAKMHSLASSGCSARVASLDTAKVTDSMSIRFLYPLQGTWLGGVRTINCIVYNPTPTLTSSLLKS